MLVVGHLRVRITVAVLRDHLILFGQIFDKAEGLVARHVSVGPASWSIAGPADDNLIILLEKRIGN